jgi:hypothetical protein
VGGKQREFLQMEMFLVINKKNQNLQQEIGLMESFEFHYKIFCGFDGGALMSNIFSLKLISSLYTSCYKKLYIKISKILPFI